jgi:hypothetical protein
MIELKFLDSNRSPSCDSNPLPLKYGSEPLSPQRSPWRTGTMLKCLVSMQKVTNSCTDCTLAPARPPASVAVFCGAYLHVKNDRTRVEMLEIRGFSRPARACSLHENHGYLSAQFHIRASERRSQQNVHVSRFFVS